MALFGLIAIFFVSAKAAMNVKGLLRSQNISYEILIGNVQSLVDAERAHTHQIRRREELNRIHLSEDPAGPFFDDYRNSTEIYNWLDGLQKDYPELIRVQTLNTTYEGRPQKLVVVTSSVGTGPKPAAFWEGGIHAREWIGVSTMCYMISKLVSGYGTDPNATFFLDNFEFHSVVIVNVDGYDYTWTTDRNWRKTRKPNTPNPCNGTDPNRNWDNNWCTVGASTSPCSDSYCGSNAFSEREVQTMANYLLAISGKQRVINFVDWHAYGQLFMAPYGWTPDPPKDADIQATFGEGAVAAIKSVNGMTYEFGRIEEIIYPASGSSADWGYDNVGIVYSYGVELRDTGEYGFLLPADQIRPQGEEIWANLVYTGNYFLSN